MLPYENSSPISDPSVPQPDNQRPRSVQLTSLSISDYQEVTSHIDTLIVHGPRSRNVYFALQRTFPGRNHVALLYNFHIVKEVLVVLLASVLS
ncbi:hypothetical protein VTL71DRAFT_1252 [Oculimacula yallundae]|uniref:Uncharacterized protein n=1 Tax=Oculimacula yallundae TaxID=86028 RepID=A0ABR4CA68_9HELO